MDEANPLGRDWLLKLQSNTYLLEVDSASTRRLEEAVQLQPRLSVPLTSDLFLITRPTFVVFDSKPFQSASGEILRASAVGDLEVPIALSPALGPSWLLGVGPTFSLPTATSRTTGSGKFEAGPAVVMGWTSDTWMASLFVQQFWSFAGEASRSSVSRMKVQYFLSRFFADGWSVGMSPTVAVNWKASGGQELTFPFGLGVGKVVRFSEGFALKLGLQLEYMPFHPDDFGREANVQVTITPVVPQPFQKPLFGDR